MITIRRAEEAFDAIWRIFHQVVQQGDTYTYDPETTREQAHSIWMSGEHTTLTPTKEMLSFLG
jgi:pullulanase/glycogen debranching enzyme